MLPLNPKSRWLTPTNTPKRVHPGWAGTALSSFRTGAEGAATSDHYGRCAVGLTLVIRCTPPAPPTPTSNSLELITKPCPTRNYSPSMCPETESPEILLKNMITTICPFNHQKYDSFSSFRQKAKYAHPPHPGR